MSKHTLGPWIVAHRVQVQDKKLGGGIALCNRYAPYDSVDQANANLISAAPDMLEALENLMDVYSEPDERICCNGADCGCMGATRRQQAEHYAREAIAKAKGE